LGVISFAISLIATVLLKEKKVKKNEGEEAGVGKKPMMKWRDVIDFSIFKDSKFIIWSIAGNLSMMAYFIPAFFLPCK
jgi:hypothetical protein